MTAYTVDRGGQINGAGATDALFLKVFSGEVLQTFNETNVMKNLTMTRNITSGKSAQFVYHGTTTAGLHTPGSQMLGRSVNHNERTILIDGILASDVSVANIDEAMSHYDLRASYAQLLGRALSKKWDMQALQVAVLAARASATISGNSGGSSLTNAAFASDGEALADGMFDAAQALDEKDVPKEDRYCVLRPAQFYAMARSTKVINRDWGGSGSFAKGKVYEVAGITIVESNNLPITSIAADSPAPLNTYHGDFSTTAGVVFHKSCMGTVSLMDLAMEKEYSVARQATLIVAKLAIGQGILRPESSVELKTA